MPHPDNTYWLEAHLRLLQGDKAAWKEIAVNFLPQLCQSLLHRWPNIDDQLLTESVNNALLHYWKDPHRFDPSRGVFLGYWLLTQARGHLSNLLRREQRHRRKEKAIGVDEEDYAQVVKIMSRNRQPEDYLLIESCQAGCSQKERRWVAKFSELEIGELELLVERAPKEQWVQLCGLKNMAVAQQCRWIAREKERLRKKTLTGVQRKDRKQGQVNSEN